MQSLEKSLIGLSSSEAKLKLLKEGPNELPSEKRFKFIYILFDVIKEPMFILLILAGIIYSILGSFDEALMLLGFVFIVIFITLFQETRTEKALEALKELSSPKVKVIRDGQEIIIPSNQVVRGDIIKIVEGDYVPADGIILLENNLLVDESLLTGESVPVRKVAGTDKTSMVIPGGDDLPCVYSGTLVVGGDCLFTVKKTGAYTEIGKIGSSLKEVKTSKTNLQLETNNLVFRFAIVALLLCASIVLFYGFIKGSWIDGILTGITLAMAILPEEFPVVLTIFLALGAWRMSKKNVLTRQQYAIQALGSVTVLCVDKTGTITKNQMSLKSLFNKDKELVINSSEEQNTDQFNEYSDLLKFSALSCPTKSYDPMDQAIKNFTFKSNILTENDFSNFLHIKEYPKKKGFLAVIHVWQRKNDNSYVIGIKGAPESLWDLCHLSNNEIVSQLRTLKDLTKRGLRVLAVGKIERFIDSLPENPHEFSFKYLGLIGFEDPIRSQVPKAVKECYKAGIAVKIITGDYPETALSIANQIGLEHQTEILTGTQIQKLSEEELQIQVKSTNVFARVLPDQKLQIVKALKDSGEIPVMTGDGINDAPALKLASVGVAMGARGTDVAREAASIVLLDDDFSTLVTGIRMGRKIFDNIRKAMSYILAVHIPIAGLTILALLLDLPLILFPVHILFLELIIDPASSIVFENQAEETDIMQRNPRSPNERIFNKKTVLISLFQGFSSLIVILLIYQGLLNTGHGENESRALAFFALILTNVIILIINVSWSRSFVVNLVEKNISLYALLLSTFTFLILIFSVSQISIIFKFSMFTMTDFLIVILSMIAFVIWNEISKKVIFEHKLIV